MNFNTTAAISASAAQSATQLATPGSNLAGTPHIAVTLSMVGAEKAQTVNARELHAFLEVGKDFSTWIKDRIAQYGFAEGQDYVFTLLPNFGEKGQGRPTKEYHLTLDMAKELAMVERNEKGKQARQYFIECERRARPAANDLLLPDFTNPAAAARAWADAIEQKQAIEAQAQQVTQQLALAAPKAEALDRISAGEDNLTFTQAAKVLSVKRDSLTQWLHANGWVYRQNKSWVAYEGQIRAGRLAYKEGKYTDENTGQEGIRPYCHITPKGLAWLAANGPKKVAA